MRRFLSERHIVLPAGIMLALGDVLRMAGLL